MTPEGRQDREALRRQGAAGRVIAFVLDRIDDADEAAAIERAGSLRAQRPDASLDELVDELIMRKCRQAAAIGAATAGSGLIPGLGTLSALTIGTMADISATLKLQTELVIEIAEVHGRRLTADEKRQVVLLVSGLSVGGSQLVAKGSTRLSLQLSQRYAQRWLARTVPYAGVAAAAGTNALSTYLIGRRAHAFFALGPEAVGSWLDSLRALAGVDERKLASWLADHTWRAPAVSATGRRLTGTLGRAADNARLRLAGGARGAARLLSRRPPQPPDA